ncbi:MAG: VOC family protein [Gemmatimonadales bacterium]
MSATAGAAPYTTPPPDYRLPAGISLGPVRLQVADLARSTDYYERVLGLHVAEREGTQAILAAQSDTRPLVDLRERAGATPVPRRGRLGLYHFALLLPDRASLGRFVAHLGGLGEQFGMADHLVSEAIYLTDPDGLGIEVYADRPRSSWRMQGDVLAMATDPLNLDELVGAGARQPWSGAPAGTRMGHVHLHVDDLEEAAAFYHAGVGLERIRLNFPGALFMSAGGYHHHLGTNTWAAGAPPAAEGDARLLEWTIRLPDHSGVEAVSRSLVDSGYRVRQDAGDALSSDPWGTTLRLTSR